jgi:Tat protein translocase TatB subunit
MQELVVIFIVALLVFGPKRLPELGRAIGKTVGQLRSAISDVKSEVEREIHTAEADVDIKELPAWKKKDEGPVAEEQQEKREGEKGQETTDESNKENA